MTNGAHSKHQVSLSASLLLAALRVPNEAACQRLLCAVRLPGDGVAWSRAGFRADSADKHVGLLRCCEALVRRMGCHDWMLVERLLHETRWAPGWRQRSQAARLLVCLGSVHTMYQLAASIP